MASALLSMTVLSGLSGLSVAALVSTLEPCKFPCYLGDQGTKSSGVCLVGCWLPAGVARLFWLAQH